MNGTLNINQDGQHVLVRGWAKTAETRLFPFDRRSILPLLLSRSLIHILVFLLSRQHVSTHLLTLHPSRLILTDHLILPNLWRVMSPATYQSLPRIHLLALRRLTRLPIMFWYCIRKLRLVTWLIHPFPLLLRLIKELQKKEYSVSQFSCTRQKFILIFGGVKLKQPSSTDVVEKKAFSRL